VHDRTSGAWSAVLAVGCGSFTLLGEEDKAHRLGAWGAVLASVARAGSPIHRLQWVERTREGDLDAFEDYLRTESDVAPGCAGTPTGAAAASYAEVIANAAVRHRAHEVLVVVSVHPRRAARHVRPFGRGPEAVCALLRREIRLLEGQLRNAEVRPDRPLGVDELARAIRCVSEPAHGGGAPVTPPSAWPMAIDEHWASVHVDNRWHATYWIAEWPRLDVGADFLTPLLLTTATRAVSLTMAPVPPAQAVREVESARTADLADAELRHRAGFVSTARHRREAEGALQREAELADGHGDYRFCGYVSVSAATPADLETVMGRAAPPPHRATTANLQAAYPFVAGGGLGARGTYLGRDLHGGAFCFDPWEMYQAGVLTSPNVMVVGQIGRGKSTFVKTLVLAC